MKKTINYEKDILFKSNIGEICSISLEHDFTVDGEFLKGDFIVSGEYKLNELSVNKEPFCYHLPLEYEFENGVDLSSLSYEVENFEYNVHEDELSVYIDFGLRYEEMKVEPLIPDDGKDEISFDDLILSSTFEEDDRTPNVEEVTDIKPVEEKKEEESIVQDDYIKYHVHIVREGDTLESIANKYNVSVDLIKKYNESVDFSLKSKVIIPECDE